MAVLLLLLLAATPAAADTDTLNRGESIRAPGDLVSGGGGVARLHVQADGNLVVVQTAGSKVLWASNTSGGGSGIHLDLQGNDGNLVLYADGGSSSNRVLWASNTDGAQKLVIQSDCNAVLYSADNKVLWASNTACGAPTPPPPPPPPPGPPPPPPGPHPGVVRIDSPGCNSCAFHQVPGHPDYFVTRLPISASGGKRDPPPGNFGCIMDGWQLALLHMDDWSTHSLSYVKTLLWPNAHDGRFPKTAVQDGKYVIDSAYDPTVALLNNGTSAELWVSFECAGQNFPGTASCMGPLTNSGVGGGGGDPGAWELDLSRTQLVVAGTPSIAASVPKIFSFNAMHPGGGAGSTAQKSYMWFDHFTTTPKPGRIEARAVELQADPATGRFWAAGKGGTMDVDDAEAITVWQPSGADSGGVADVFAIDVTADGRQLLVLAGLGPKGCDNPAGPGRGCYRVAVARANFARGERLADEDLVDGAALPGNAQEYARFMAQPDGSRLLYASFQSPRSNPGYAIPGPACEGLLLNHSAADPGFWSDPCRAEGKQYPDWGRRGRECRPSCGGLHGTSSSDTPCAGGKRDMGKAWDVPYCCGDSSSAHNGGDSSPGRRSAY